MAATTKMDGKARRVAEGIQLRNGRYIVRIWNADKGKTGGYDWHSLEPGATLTDARTLKRKLEDRKASGRRAGAAALTVADWAGRYERGREVPAPLVCRGCEAKMMQKTNAGLCGFCIAEGRPALPAKRTVIAPGDTWVPGRWLQMRPRKSETTNLHNDSRVRAFAREFAGRAMASITEEEAQLFVLEFPGTFKEVHAMYNDAMALRLVDRNPFAGLKVPTREGRRNIVVLTDAELKQLTGIARAVHGLYGDLFAAMIQTAAWTGLRPSELFLLSLERADRLNYVDLRAGVVHVAWQLGAKTKKVQRPKKESQREVVLLPGAEDALRSIRSWQTGMPVFLTKRGTPFTQRSHFYYWDPVRAAFAASLPAGHHIRQRETDSGEVGNLDFYELRHFFGTKLAHPPAGVEPATPYEIAAMMGHKDGGQLAMERYIHVGAQEAQDSIRRAWRKAS